MKSKLPLKLNMVIGNPIKQSKSPVLHGQIYKFLKLNAVTLPVCDSDVEKLVKKIRDESIELTAVTMPFKKNILPFLNNVEKIARKINAVNTVINKNGKLFGYNTDVDGIRYALRNVILKNKKVLLIGAGGAAHAVAYVIKEQKGKLIYQNRTSEKSLEMQKIFKGQLSKEGKWQTRDIDVIINATPVGMFPDNSSLPMLSGIIDKHQVVFDLVYNPVETKLLKVSRKRGAKIISGIDMFIAQGIKQIELWTGKNIINQNLVSRLKKIIIKNQ